MSSTAPNYKFEYDMHQAISVRGKIPYDILGSDDYIPNGDKPFSFSESCNFAEIDRYIYRDEGDFQYSLCFDVLCKETRKVSQKKWGRCYRAWRAQYGANSPNQSLSLVENNER